MLNQKICIGVISMSMIYTGKSKVGDVNEDNIVVECSCGTHSFKITSYSNDEDVYISIWSNNVYSKQNPPFLVKLWKRLKSIWFAICGKEYLLEDFVLSKDDTERLDYAIKRILECRQKQEEVE